MPDIRIQHMFGYTYVDMILQAQMHGKFGKKINIFMLHAYLDPTLTLESKYHIFLENLIAILVQVLLQNIK